MRGNGILQILVREEENVEDFSRCLCVLCSNCMGTAIGKIIGITQCKETGGRAYCSSALHNIMLCAAI